MRCITNSGGFQRVNSSSYLLPKMTKLDFTRVNCREDHTSWLCRVEHLFETHVTAREERVSLSSLHLEGEAQLWYQLLKHERPVILWDEFKDFLNSQYGSDQFL